MDENPFAPPRIVDQPSASVPKPKLPRRRTPYSFAIAFVSMSAVLFWWQADEHIFKIVLILLAFSLPPLAIAAGITWMCKRAERRWPKDHRPQSVQRSNRMHSKGY